MNAVRWKVACINWSAPADVPHATAYAMVDGEMVGDWYFPTWAEALAFANDHATRRAAR